MTIDAFAGPLVVFGQTPPAPGFVGAAQDSNPNLSPSLFLMGHGILDPRYAQTYIPGNPAKKAQGWWGNETVVTMDQVPSTHTTTAIVAAAPPTGSGTPLTLVTSSGAGITVGVSIVRADTGATVTVLAIDGAMGLVNLTPTVNGDSGNQMYDPTKSLARAVQIQSAGDDSGAVFHVRGYDIYNYPVEESITGAAIGTAAGKKAFKYIQSITPIGTLSGSNVSVGQSDVLGFPIRADSYNYQVIEYPAPTLIASATGFTAAVTTSPATATTGDVRGTYTLQSASNGTNRIMIVQKIPVANVGTATGLFGVTQFADF